MLTSSKLFAVIELTFDQLSKHDQLELLCVCKDWHRNLEHQLYRHVDIENEDEYKQWLCKLTQSKETPRPLGHNIQILKLDSGTLKKRTVEGFLKMCPNIRNLELWPDGYSTEEVASACGALRNLSRLEISLANDIDVLEILRHAPQVESVEIRFYIPSGVHVFEYAEDIHKACPRLKSLVLEPHYDGFDAPRAIVDEEYYSKLTPAPTLTKFGLEVERRSYNCTDLLLYCAHKYPSLRHLEMTSWRMKKFPDIKYKVDPFALFAKSCPNLVYLDWFAHCAPDVRLFDALAAAGTKLTKLRISDSVYDESLPPFRCFRLYERLFLSTLRHNITDFSTVHWPYYSAMTANELVSDLRWLPNLTRLALRAEDVEDAEDRLHYTDYEYDVEHLLDCCPRLVKLELSECYRLVVPGTPTYKVKNHPLQCLEIKESNISKGVLPLFSDLCRQLRSLSLSVCRLEAQGYEIAIDMPHTALRYINIDTVTSRSNQDVVIKFFSCTNVPKSDERQQSQQHQGDLAQWYYMADLKHPRSRWDHQVANIVNKLSHDEARLVEALKTRSTTIERLLEQLYPDNEITRPLIWKPQDLYDGYFHLTCQSAKHIFFNKKQL
ncbi:hypothetical protein DFQ28_008752 [Apophysomyces sp. BC1034]|nr:hypothetical protein DFQ30_002858 [Apophysomyces sp. BC1015]KAG0174440.1 hypothetical protein DFQ29_007484 [Apophysomyces sp. BC1021]KAG0185806.1 hypothetical protein DFQ28_008752 [Apophysomyces sp. BC1034]